MLSQHSLHYALSPSPSEWISDYEDSVLDPEALRMEVDAFMEAYDKKIAEVGLQQDSRVSLVLCIVVCCL
jgi:hypothetical protein